MSNTIVNTNNPSEYAQKLYFAISNRSPMRLDELSGLPFDLRPDDLPLLFEWIGRAYVAELEMQRRLEYTVGGIFSLDETL